MLTASPTKFVPLFGFVFTTGATAFVAQTFVTASSYVVATAKLVTCAKKLVVPPAWRNAKPRAAGGDTTSSPAVTEVSSLEIGFTHRVASSLNNGGTSDAVGSQPTTT